MNHGKATCEVLKYIPDPLPIDSVIYSNDSL